MEVQHFDENGNKINETPNTNQSNNPSIIHHNRLDSLPIVRIGDSSKSTQNESAGFKTSVTQEKEIPFQTKVTKAKSKYEVDNETTFLIEFGVLFTDSQIIIIPKENFSEADDIANNLYEKHWVKFRMWNFMESTTWKQECMDFLPAHRVFNLNSNKFNELKVRRLLLDWSFKDYGDDHKLFHINKQLTDEGMDLFFKRFNPHIIQHIVNKMNDFLGD